MITSQSESAVGQAVELSQRVILATKRATITTLKNQDPSSGQNKAGGNPASAADGTDDVTLADKAQIEILRKYADGLLGTGEAIEFAGFNDYADLLIALAQNGMTLPKPADTRLHQLHLRYAREVLQPILRCHDR